jgi:hypothetical protein
MSALTRPFMRMEPPSGFIRPCSSLRSVLWPAPLPPMTARLSPRPNSKDNSRNAQNSAGCKAAGRSRRRGQNSAVMSHRPYQRERRRRPLNTPSPNSRPSCAKPRRTPRNPSKRPSPLALPSSRPRRRAASSNTAVGSHPINYFENGCRAFCRDFRKFVGRPSPGARLIRWRLRWTGQRFYHEMAGGLIWNVTAIFQEIERGFFRGRARYPSRAGPSDRTTMSNGTLPAA